MPEAAKTVTGAGDATGEEVGELEQVEGEISTLSERLRELELELAALSHPEPVEWGDADLEERLLEAERRKAVLPRLIRAGQVKLLQLRKRAYELQLRPLEADLEEEHRLFERAEGKLTKAREERDAAHEAWNRTLSAAEGLRRRIKHTDREIVELSGGGP